MSAMQTVRGFHARRSAADAFGCDDLTPSFFEETMGDALGTGRVEVVSVAPAPHEDTGGSVLTAGTRVGLHKSIGLYPKRITYRAYTSDRDYVHGVRDVMVKIKATDLDITQAGRACAALCGRRVAATFEQYAGSLDHVGGHVRELALYTEERDLGFSRHVPTVYGTHTDDAREAYVVIMELLPNSCLTFGASHPDWSHKEVLAAIDGIASVHAIWYGREEALLARSPWMAPMRTAAQMIAMTPLWEALLDFGIAEYPHWFGPREHMLHRGLIASLPRWWAELDAMPKALVHNDFTPRNIALRNGPGGLRLCAYDWELATLLPAQHDLAELLAHVLPPDVTRAEVNAYIERHHIAVEQTTRQRIPKDRWYRGMHLCIADLLVNRLALSMMVNAVHRLDFLEETVAVARRLYHLTLPGAIQPASPRR